MGTLAQKDFYNIFSEKIIQDDKKYVVFFPLT